MKVWSTSQVEHRLAESDGAEDDSQEDEGERDRKADEDADEKRAKRDQAENFRTHGHSFRIAAWRLLINSDTPWISSNAAVTGMTVLKG